jgi:ketosteroid isomerase-like protein
MVFNMGVMVMSVVGIQRMRASALFALATIFVLGIGGDNSRASSVDEAVRDVVTRYHDALAAMDSVSARALLADDVVVLENGYLETAEEYLSHHLPSDMAFASAVPSERGSIQVTVLGDVAWTISIAQSVGEYKGRNVDSVIAELMVLSRAEGEWKIRAIHWSSRRRS